MPHIVQASFKHNKINCYYVNMPHIVQASFKHNMPHTVQATFKHNKINCYYVNMDFGGFYELVLYSNGFDETKISLKIIIFDHLLFTQMLATFPRTQSRACKLSIPIICLSIAVVFSVISVIMLVVYWSIRRRLKEWKK